MKINAFWHNHTQPYDISLHSRVQALTFVSAGHVTYSIEPCISKCEIARLFGIKSDDQAKIISHGETTFKVIKTKRKKRRAQKMYAPEHEIT